MNSYRSVWDSLSVHNDPSKLPEKPTPNNHKTPRRNGDASPPNHVISVTPASRSLSSPVPAKGAAKHSSSPVGKLDPSKRGHSDSVFEYLRELQTKNGVTVKGVLKATNTSLPDERAPVEAASDRGPQEVPEDQQLSTSSTDGCSTKSPASPTHGDPSDPAPTPSTISPAATAEADNSASTVFRVDVKETYQFAFLMNNDSAMAIPECADSFEASYQIQGVLDKNGAMDIPVNFEPQLFLPENRDSFDEFLRDAIDSFLQEVQRQIDATRQLVKLSRFASCHEESVSLRQKAFFLICAILPDLTFQAHFDCTSPHLERLLDYVLEVLTEKVGGVGSDPTELQDVEMEQSVRDCYVDLCDDPDVCLGMLKKKVLRVIHLLLPQLKLPEAFNIDKDLSPLLKSITECVR